MELETTAKANRRRNSKNEDVRNVGRDAKPVKGKEIRETV